MQGLTKVFGRLKGVEKFNVVAYPISSAIGFESKRRADKYTMKTFNIPSVDGYDGTDINAYYHAAWNAFMVHDVGFIRAVQFGSAHECGEKGKETEMDRHNNEIGRAIGVIYLHEEETFKRMKNKFEGTTYTHNFIFLDRTFTISDNSNPYDIMSVMLLQAGSKGKFKITRKR